MQKVGCKIHPRNSSQWQDGCEHHSVENTQFNVVVRSPLDLIVELIKDQVHDAARHHHMTRWRSRWCLASSLSLIEGGSCKRCISGGFMYPPIWPVFREDPFENEIDEVTCNARQQYSVVQFCVERCQQWNEIEPDWWAKKCGKISKKFFVLEKSKKSNFKLLKNRFL